MLDDQPDAVSSLLGKAETQRACVVCGDLSDTRCSVCKLAHYCGGEHQKQDWIEHKHVCADVATLRVQAPIGDDMSAAKSKDADSLLARAYAVLSQIVAYARRVTTLDVYRAGVGVIGRFAQLLARIVSSSFEAARNAISEMLCLMPGVSSALKMAIGDDAPTASPDVVASSNAQLNSRKECEDALQAGGSTLLRGLYTVAGMMSNAIKFVYDLITNAAKRAAAAMMAVLDDMHARFSTAGKKSQSMLDEMYAAIGPVVFFALEAAPNMVSMYSAAMSLIRSDWARTVAI